MAVISGTSAKQNQTQSSQVIDFTKAPISSRAFDWVFTLFVFLISIGIFLDGWSHSEYGPDQSVFSEYHLLFYTSLTVIALWLFGNAYLNKREGYSGLKAIPKGYALSALGIFIFGIFGVFDLIGHKIFGFEVDFEALFSPAHTGIFLGWALISIGPARAALHRRERALQNGLAISSKQNWLTEMSQILPALIAWISFTNVLAFFSMNFFATNNLYMVQNYRHPAAGMDFRAQMLSVMGIMFQSAVMFGCLVWLIKRFKLPFGTFIIFFLGIGLFTGITNVEFGVVPVFFIAGVICEGLYLALRPSYTRQVQLHVFSTLAGFAFWLIFYAYIMLTNFYGGQWFTPYLWTGTVVYGGIASLFVSLLTTSSSGIVDRLTVLEEKAQASV